MFSLVTWGAPLVPLLFLLAFLILSVAIGRRILQWFGVAQGGAPLEQLLVAFALGAGALQFVPLALGAMGLLSVRSTRLTITLVALVAAADLWAGRARFVRNYRWPEVRSWQWVWLAALSPALVLSLLTALAPTIDPDGLGYHLTVPKRWLQSGTLGYLPTYTYSNTPMGVEMLFTIALSFAGDAAAKCLHFLLGLGASLGLYLAGRRLHSSAVGAVAATLFLVGPFPVIALLGLAYIDGAVAFAMIVSVLAWLVWFQSGERSWLRCAALLAGFAVSFKMTSALFPIMMAALTVVAALLDDRERRRATPLLLGPVDWSLLLLVAIPVVPWLLRSMLITGNPFFPLFSVVIPSRDLSPIAAAAFEDHFRYWNWGTTLGGDWTLERRRLLLAAAAGIAVLAGATAFAVLRSRMARAVVVVLVGTILVQLSAVGLYTRLWIGIAAVMALPIVGILGRHLSAPRVKASWILLAALGSGLQVSREIENIDGDVAGVARAALGMDRDAFLRRRLPLLPLYEHANRELPQSARILITFNCIGFYLERTTFCDESIQESIRWTTWEDFVSDLQGLGVTHVIAPRVFATGGQAPPLISTSLMRLQYQHQTTQLSRLLGGHATALATAADQGLYALDQSITAVDR